MNLRPSGYEKMSTYLRNAVRTSKNGAAVLVSPTKRRRMVLGMLTSAHLPQTFPSLKWEKWKSEEGKSTKNISELRIFFIL